MDAAAAEAAAASPLSEGQTPDALPFSHSRLPAPNPPSTPPDRWATPNAALWGGAEGESVSKRLQASGLLAVWADTYNHIQVCVVHHGIVTVKG